MGTRAGVANICLIIRGEVFFLELKTASGRQSPEQMAFAAAARTAGATYAIARSPEEAKGCCVAGALCGRTAGRHRQAHPGSRMSRWSITGPSCR